MKKIQLSEGVYTVELDRPDEPIHWDARFRKPTDLCELHIPDGAQVIEEKAFQYCDNLLKIYMPESITYLGDALFYGTYHAIEIYYAGTAERFMEIGSPRKVVKAVQISGEYDHQPYNSGVGSYYSDQLVWEAFDSFCAKCEVICSDGEHLHYGYKKSGE